VKLRRPLRSFSLLTVVSLGAREANPDTGWYSRKIQFDVNEPFKGTKTGVITVTRIHARLAILIGCWGSMERKVAIRCFKTVSDVT